MVQSNRKYLFLGRIPRCSLSTERATDCPARRLFLSKMMALLVSSWDLKAKLAEDPELTGQRRRQRPGPPLRLRRKNKPRFTELTKSWESDSLGHRVPRARGASVRNGLRE